MDFLEPKLWLEGVGVKVGRVVAWRTPAASEVCPPILSSASACWVDVNKFRVGFSVHQENSGYCGLFLCSLMEAEHAGETAAHRGAKEREALLVVFTSKNEFGSEVVKPSSTTGPGGYLVLCGHGLQNSETGFTRFDPLHAKIQCARQRACTLARPPQVRSFHLWSSTIPKTTTSPRILGKFQAQVSQSAVSCAGTRRIQG